MSLAPLGQHSLGHDLVKKKRERNESSTKTVSTFVQCKSLLFWLFNVPLIQTGPHAPCVLIRLQTTPEYQLGESQQ